MGAVILLGIYPLLAPHWPQSILVAVKKHMLEFPQLILHFRCLSNVEETIRVGKRNENVKIRNWFLDPVHCNKQVEGEKLTTSMKCNECAMRTNSRAWIRSVRTIFCTERCSEEENFTLDGSHKLGRHQIKCHCCQVGWMVCRQVWLKARRQVQRDNVTAT